MSKTISRSPRAALMAFSALVGVAGVMSAGQALAQNYPASAIIVSDGDELEITEDVTGDPAVRFLGAANVTVASGATLTGTGDYQEFPPQFSDYFWTDGRGAVILNVGGGSLTIEEGATAIGENYGVTTFARENTFEPGVGWSFNDFTSDPTAESNITIVNNGDIIGKADDGIRVFNHATIVNTGTIIGARDLPDHEDANIPGSIGDGISSANVGVQDIENFPEDGVTLRVDNSGTIIGRRMGIIASAGSVINNSGTIHGQSSGVLMQTSVQFGGTNVVLIPYISNSLTNSGSITADFQNGVNVQSWSRTTGEPYDLSEIDPEDYDFFDVFDATTADAVLINSGLIETFADSGGTTTGVVVDPVTGEQVPVEGASTFYAVRMGSVNGYILNTEEGVIRALNGANGVRLSANAGNDDISLHGSIVLDNQGSIYGSIIGANVGTDSETGEEIEGPGQELIRNNGLIDGDVALGSGDDVFWLDANGSVTGTIDMGDGDDLMIWNTLATVGDIVTGGLGSNTLALILGGTEFDAATVFNFDTVLTFGAGDLNQIDLSFVPEIEVNEGASLDIGATGFGGVAFINPGGELVGIGEVEAIIVFGAAQLAPGNSIGTITVTGDVTLSSAVTYDVEVSPVGSDQILADGVVTLDGGAVVVSGEDGVDLAPGEALDSYVILAGAAGLTGEFATISDTLRFYNANLVYSGTEVTLELEPVGADFIAAAGNANELGIGTVLYDALLDANGDLLDVLTDSFPGLDDAGVRQGLNSLSGAAHTWAPIAVSELGAQITRLSVAGPMLAAGDTRAWISGMNGSLDIDSSSAAVGANMDADAVAFGYNGGVSDRTTVGVFAGFGSAQGDDPVGGEMDSDGFFVGGRLATMLGSGFSLSGVLGYLDQDAQVDRNIDIGGVSRVASSEYNIDGAFGGVEIAWNTAVGTGFTAGVFGSATLGSYEADDVTETDAGSLNLSSTGTEFDRASYRIGARLSGDIGFVRPRLEVGYQMEDGDEFATQTFQLAGAPGQFDVRGPSLNENAPFVSVGAEFRFSDAVSASVGYDGVFGDTTDSHGAVAKLSFSF